MNMRNLIFMIVVLGIFSCSGNSKKKIETDIKYTDLEFKPLGLDKDAILNPQSMILFDSLLLVSERHNEKGYSILNINSCKVLGRYVNIGRGPGEVIHSSAILKTGDRSFQVNNSNLRNVLFFSIDSLLKGNEKPYKVIKYNEIPQSEKYFLNSLNSVDDSLLVGLGAFEGHKYLICNKEDNNKYNVTFKYEYPGDKRHEHKEEIPITKFMVYNGKIVVSPDRKKVFYSCYRCFYYEIFNVVDDKLIKRMERIDYYPLYKKYRDGQVTFLNNNKVGIISTCCTSNFIYVLNSGRSNEEYGDNTCYSQELLKIDWDGNIVNRFKLDRNTRNIAVDENNNRMYVSSINPETYYEELGYYEI